MENNGKRTNEVMALEMDVEALKGADKISCRRSYDKPKRT